MKKVISIIMLLVFILIDFPYNISVSAKTSYNFITIGNFALKLAEELDLLSSENQPIDAIYSLKQVNIIKDNEFKDSNSYITRGYLMVLINRADEYLYGNHLSDEFIEYIMNNRISDINEVKASRRLDIAKAYYKGYVVGYSNGLYSTNRNLKLKCKISNDAAQNCIKMLNDTKLRSKLRSDGQLIRTNNLPSNSKSFNSILDSFPNSYYESTFMYENEATYFTEDGYRTTGGYRKTMYEAGLYISPRNLNKLTYDTYKQFERDGYTLTDTTKIVESKILGYKKDIIDDVVKKAKLYLNTVLNVDYRTINEDEFKKNLIYSMAVADYNIKNYEEDIDYYLKMIKKNKTIINCSSADLDNEVMYNCDGEFYIRAHVRYRITSCNIPSDLEYGHTSYNNPYNFIIYNRTFVFKQGYVKNKWEDYIYEIQLNHDGYSIKTTRWGVLAVDINK